MDYDCSRLFENGLILLHNQRVVRQRWSSLEPAGKPAMAGS
jgi:hypothetical protein